MFFLMRKYYLVLHITMVEFSMFLRMKIKDIRKSKLNNTIRKKISHNITLRINNFLPSRCFSVR